MSKETKLKKKQIQKSIKECKEAIQKERSKLFDLVNELSAIDDDYEEVENYLENAIEAISRCL